MVRELGEFSWVISSRTRGFLACLRCGTPCPVSKWTEGQAVLVMLSPQMREEKAEMEADGGFLEMKLLLPMGQRHRSQTHLKNQM